MKEDRSIFGADMDRAEGRAMKRLMRKRNPKRDVKAMFGRADKR